MVLNEIDPDTTDTELRTHSVLNFATHTMSAVQVFFSSPEEDQLFGRVLLGRGPLVGAAYPLYFRVSLLPSIVPGAWHESQPSEVRAVEAGLRSGRLTVVFRAKATGVGWNWDYANQYWWG
jgi:hypothetical protein